MYIKYIEQKISYASTVIDNTYLINTSEIFSIKCTKRTEEYTKPGGFSEVYLKEFGFITIYKTDKMYHQFNFTSHKNTDEFIMKLEEYIINNESIVKEIIIEHEVVERPKFPDKENSNTFDIKIN